MGVQIWNLKGEISGNFSLVYREFLKCSSPPHPAVKKIIIDPEFNNKKEQTGKFNIDLTFEVNTEEDKLLSSVIIDMGRDIFYMYVDLLAFLSGYPIYILKPPYMVYNYPGTNKYRQITFPSQQVVLEPPIPLINTVILTIKLEQKHRMVLGWLRRALQEKNVINSILNLFIPLEILANLFPCKEKIISKCENCGQIKKLRPGTRKQVENLLINEIGYKKEQFEKIWDSRIKIIHGELLVSSEQIRELNIIKQDLILAIIKGMKKILNMDVSDPPREMSPKWAFTDPILDTEYQI